MSLLLGSDFDRLFRSFERTARRLESRDRYDVQGEREYLVRWRKGAQVDPEHERSRQPWLATVRANVRAGRSYQRVRVVSQPLSEYVRFALRGTRQTVDAGEDIRYLTRDRANGLELPDHDFWLFDESKLVLLNFTSDDRPVGGLLVTDANVVAQHLAWLDVAAQSSTPYAEFLAEDTSREFPAGSS